MNLGDLFSILVLNKVVQASPNKPPTMFKFFDYVYFIACNYYANQNRSNPGITALITVSFLQMLNILLFIFSFTLLLPHKPSLNKYLLGGVISLTLLILNGIRYNKKNFEVLKQVWGNEENNKRKKRQTLIVIYIVLSLILCFGIAGYLGSKNW